MQFLTELGHAGLIYLWIPLGLWTLVALPLWMVSKYLGRYQPLIHFRGSLALLLALPLGFMVMPLIEPPVSIVSLPSTLTVLADSAEPPVNQHLSAPALPLTAPASVSVTNVPLNQQDESLRELLLWLSSIFMFGALVASLVALARLASSWIVLLLIKRVLMPASASDDAMRLMRQTANALGIHKPIRLLYGASTISPMTFGWRRPVIILPENLTGTSDKLQIVLTHELIHIKRGDYPLGLLAKVFGACFVFHPLVVLLLRDFDLCREMSCDTATLNHLSTEPAAYARLLLDFSKVAEKNMALSMVERKSLLKRRVFMMANYNRTDKQLSTWMRTILFTTMLLLPALLMACSTSQEGTMEAGGEVAKLEAQVAYLRAEIRDLRTKVDSLAATGEGRRQTEYTFNNNRLLLLQQMQVTQMQNLEMARMEAATAEWMEKLSAE